MVLCSTEYPFRDFLDYILSAITLITVGEENNNTGMTASWNTQVSWDPPLVGVAIYREWRTL